MFGGEFEGGDDLLGENFGVGETEREQRDFSDESVVRHHHCNRTKQRLDTDADASIQQSTASPYSITERRVPQLIPVLGSQPADDVSHKPGGRLPLLSARPAVTLATIKRAATYFAAW